ncbi:MAG TPA: sigma-70 family RNA polymerase sigma factor [Pseudolabrys sp.]|nr:sigma-70 family RNA polymerase sigma factor [Pseudolabrys sp.]
MDLDANRNLLVAALARVAGGDRIALQTVYRLASAKLFGVCLRILHQHSDAEDVLQEVYLTIWRKAGEFNAATASPMTWLIAIARNRAIDRLRAQGKNRRMMAIDVVANLPDDGTPADVAIERSERNERLHECLGGLAAHENAALRGAFFDGNTYEELAERMDVPLGTMKSWIRRAMLKLKACLQR